jgi:hypothetical protein
MAVFPDTKSSQASGWHSSSHSDDYINLPPERKKVSYDSRGRSADTSGIGFRDELDQSISGGQAPATAYTKGHKKLRVANVISNMSLDLVQTRSSYVMAVRNSMVGYPVYGWRTMEPRHTV